MRCWPFSSRIASNLRPASVCRRKPPLGSIAIIFLSFQTRKLRKKRRLSPLSKSGIEYPPLTGFRVQVRPVLSAMGPKDEPADRDRAMVSSLLKYPRHALPLPRPAPCKHDDRLVLYLTPRAHPAQQVRSSALCGHDISLDGFRPSLRGAACSSKAIIFQVPFECAPVSACCQHHVQRDCRNRFTRAMGLPAQ